MKRARWPVRCFFGSGRGPLRVVSPDLRRGGSDHGDVGAAVHGDGEADRQAVNVGRRQHGLHLHAGMAKLAAGAILMLMLMTIGRAVCAKLRCANDRQGIRRRHRSTRPSRQQRLDRERQGQQDAEESSRLSVCDDPAPECHASRMPYFLSPVIATSCTPVLLPGNDGSHAHATAAGQAQPIA